MNAISSYNLQEYLQASSEASKRSRKITITLVVASVLMLVGLLNSYQKTWMLQRVQRSADPTSEYVRLKLWPGMNSDSLMSIVDSSKASAALGIGSLRLRREFLDSQYSSFYRALIASYVENAFTIRIPFFGVAFDVNDLGMLGGLGIIVALVLFRFSLARELDNLVLSFEEARKVGMMKTVYELIAMHQVLTVPPMPGRRRSRAMINIPRALVFLPCIIHLAVVSHDFATSGIGNAIDPGHTLVIFILNSMLWTFILTLTLSCLNTLLNIDDAWMEYWKELYGNNASTGYTSSRVGWANSRRRQNNGLSRRGEYV